MSMKLAGILIMLTDVMMHLLTHFLAK